MSEMLRKQLDNLSKEDLDTILSPLNSLINKLKHEITIFTELNCKDENGENSLAKNKEYYQDYMQFTLVELVNRLVIKDENVIDYTIEKLLYIHQNILIIKAWDKATDIENFCGRLTSSLENLKDKKMLENFYISRAA
ncbi:hypothetical protein [Nostoc sp.]|uniref:hypothetical protein n=1 Tax=Nostoc sp. TaxID=1180 RepID=UPI002FF8BB0E